MLGHHRAVDALGCRPRARVVDDAGVEEAIDPRHGKLDPPQPFARRGQCRPGGPDRLVVSSGKPETAVGIGGVVHHHAAASLHRLDRPRRGGAGENHDAGLGHGWGMLPVPCYPLALVANIKSQIKRNRQNERRRLKNKAVRSEVKTRVKTAVLAAEAGAENSAEALRIAVKRLDKAAAKGVIHKNQAANRKSRLMRRIANLTSSSAS